MTVIWVNYRFEGFHFWKEAPEEVKYLRNIHRHEFHVSVRVKVTHNDREVEFHLLKKDFIKVVFRELFMFSQETAKPYSCETMAKMLLRALEDSYKVMSVTVSEDGECGATVYAD